MDEQDDERVFDAEHNYYYSPYTEDGPYMTAFGVIGKTVGKTLADAFLSEDPTKVSKFIAGKTGAELGEDIGWATDNWTKIKQNFDTLMSQLNDPRTWIISDDVFR